MRILSCLRSGINLLIPAMEDDYFPACFPTMEHDYFPTCFGGLNSALFTQMGKIRGGRTSWRSLRVCLDEIAKWVGRQYGRQQRIAGAAVKPAERLPVLHRPLCACESPRRPPPQKGLKAASKSGLRQESTPSPPSALSNYAWATVSSTSKLFRFN